MRGKQPEALRLKPPTGSVCAPSGHRVISWRSWDFCSAEVFDRGEGEATRRSDQHRLVFSVTPRPPMLLQLDSGPATVLHQAPASVGVYPAGLQARTVGANSRYVQVCWKPELYHAIAPHRPGPPRIAMRVAQRLAPPPPGPDLPRPRLRRVLDYIEAHLDQGLTLAELADVACLSPCHLSRSFKQEIGTGPQRYTVRRRVERAKALLRHSDASLASIAATVGFADQSHFTAAFRQEIGMTPGRFRAASA